MPSSKSASSCSIITLGFLIICLFTFASCQNPLPGDTLRQGDSLNFNSQLVSSARNFTLGFYTPDRTNDSYVAIWYTDAPSTYFPVWIGNRNNPVPNNSTPNMSISSTGNLVVNYGRGESPIELYTGDGSPRNVSATLLESGNFVLRQVTTDGSEVVLWQSFDYPTDTLFPGMRLGVNHRTGRNWTLTSWFGENNPAPGAFTLEWDFTTNRMLVRRRGVVYWTSGEMRDYTVEPGNLRVREFPNMDSPDPLSHNFNFTNITSNDEQYFEYSRLIVPDNILDFRTVVSGWRLGYLGDMLDYRSDGGQSGLALVSTCYGYNTERGCELREQMCNDRRQIFQRRAGFFSPVNGRGPPTNYDDSTNTTISLSDCRELCWNDCECAGYEDMESGCIRYTGRNLRFEQSLDGTNANMIYVLQSRSPNNRSRTLLQIIIPVVVGTLLLIVIVALLLLRRSKRKKQEEDMHELLTLEGYTEAYDSENGGTKGHDLRLFSYASIVAATQNFSSNHKLGEGGFGPVYKGRTPEGHEIAVKLLSRSSGQGLLEFKTELILISKLQHVNLVKLVGFSVHGEDKMIVYEYMPNKSLDFFLFDQSKREQLDWDRRFTIIEGIAQGILYLHKYSRLSIVHRDLKCSNILLDENLNPKIADFGLARIFKQDTDEANTNRRVGTYGYMAPEYAMQGIFSFKSDVYSFGVLVLEIVSGRKNSSFHHVVEGPLNLVECAWELWCKDSAEELMDPILRRSCKTEQLQRCINIALLCVENRAVDRPSIEDVMLMLKNETATVPLPKNPSFITRNSVVAELGKTTGETPSMNEVSVSEMTGR